MEGSPAHRPQPSPRPVDFPKPYSDNPFQSTTEGYGDDTHSPAEAIARSPSSSSTPSMRDSVTTNVRNTSSIGSGSSVTQLTHDDDTPGIKSNLRDKIPREPRHHKPKATHRLSGLSASESEPYPVTPGAFPSPTQSTVHLKSRTKHSPGTPSTLSSASNPLPGGAAFVQSPISPSSVPSWPSNYPGPGYPPFYDPTTAGQQHPGSAPIDQQYYPGFNYFEPSSHPGAAFVHYPPSYYSPPPRTHDDMAGRNRVRIRGDDVPILPLEDMTGYAKLAGSLTGQLRPRITPLYRQFEWLTHRLLLSYQDRLVELEERLLRCDASDTELRARDGRRGRVPASERDERDNESDFLMYKRETKTEIEYLLDKYTHLLISVGQIRRMPPATRTEIEAYHAFLDRHRLIVAAETEFLRADDLISVAPATDPGQNQAQRQGPRPDLIYSFSVLGLIFFAILLVVLPDLKGRLTVFLCFAALGTGVLRPTGHLRQLRQLFAHWVGGY